MLNLEDPGDLCCLVYGGRMLSFSVLPGSTMSCVDVAPLGVDELIFTFHLGRAGVLFEFFELALCIYTFDTPRTRHNPNSIIRRSVDNFGLCRDNLLLQ